MCGLLALTPYGMWLSSASFIYQQVHRSLWGKRLKNVISAHIIVFLLLGSIAFAIEIPPVNAWESIYIRADGSVDPPTAPIASTDNVTYTLTDDIYNTAVFVERDNIVVDGAGYTLYGEGGYTYRVGVSLVGRSNVAITNMNLVAFSVGIDASGSWNTVISGNSVANSSVSGVRLDSTSDCAIVANNITGCEHGIFLTESSNNTIVGNRITGFYPGGSYSDSGINLNYSSLNNIARNVIMDTVWGINMRYSNSNAIVENRFEGNIGHIPAYESSSNRVVHNSFIGYGGCLNVQSENVWNDGYPEGGNYWGDYSGSDLYHGVYQNETGSDGIGDTPYTNLNSAPPELNNTDHYPLMNPYNWGDRNIAVTFIGGRLRIDLPIILPMKTIVGAGYQMSFLVFVKNYGNNPEISNVTVYANATVIGTQTNVFLEANSTAILEFMWDTIGWSKDNYVFTAVADPVPDETDTLDNSLSFTMVFLGLPGDVDGNGVTNMLDVYLIAIHFGARVGDLGYVRNYDIEDDGLISMLDLYHAALCFGRAFP